MISQIFVGTPTFCIVKLSVCIIIINSFSFIRRYIDGYTKAIYEANDVNKLALE